ncbi:MAG: hydroxylamine reductase [Chitinivibrionales bacterium]
MQMFCNQCEQTAKGKGCEVKGVCGKEPSTSNLQDLIIEELKGIGDLAFRMQEFSITDSEADRFTTQALFTTVTNVNFDDERLINTIKEAETLKKRLRKEYVRGAQEAGKEINPDDLPDIVNLEPDTEDTGKLYELGDKASIAHEDDSEDIASLKEILTYGLKGMAAYADHACILGKSDQSVFSFFHEALSALNRVNPDMEELLNLVMKCGETNIRTMELLDAGHTERFGHPEPTEVRTSLKPGPAIIISGHDLLDLDELLKQTQGKGVNVYTHGEMLPAHGYPELKKYEHLAGHFGTAWQNQQKEFHWVEAAFLFTTNCIQRPRSSYKDRVFTKGLVGWPGVKHIKGDDYSEIIETALSLKGLEHTEGKPLMTGFARNAVVSVADKVISGVKSGDIRHFFLIGGCDGAKPGRNYYTEFAEKTPEDTLILTLACGKFRINHLDLGEINGIPRLLDVGQCNDAFSAVKIALALADAFECGVNDLPLSFILSWYEQKAVVILLSLLYLGIKDIRVGPSLPAFISPGVLNYLVDNFSIKPAGSAEEDINAALEAK